MISGSGPIPAKIMIIGEAPGESDLLSNTPFSGASRHTLFDSLLQVGIRANECYFTYAYKDLPAGGHVGAMIADTKREITPHHKLLFNKMVLPQLGEACEALWREVASVKPNIIIALGNLPLFFLTGEWGITSWRGSILPTISLPEGMDYRPKVLPTYSPSQIFGNMSWRPIFQHDLAKAAREANTPDLPIIRENFLVAPTYEQALDVLFQLHTQLEEGTEDRMKLAVDIETRLGHMTCLGIAWSPEDAICIPFTKLRASGSYWEDEAQEATIAYALYKVLTHPRAGIVGQNFSYDAQYIHRWLHFIPNFLRDTMIAQHTMYSSLPKSLDFLSSMYRQNHIYWKHENESWEYNCRDAVITYEVDTEQQKFIDKMGLREQHDFQQSLFFPVLDTMLKGIRVDSSLKANFALELQDAMNERQAYLNDVCGEELNIRSSTQMQRFFYQTLGIREVKSRKSGNATTDDEALRKIGEREPLLLPIVSAISDLRSLGVFYSTFISASTDIDDRMRSTFSIAGTSTYRFSSSKNAFGSGLNFQNIPSGTEGTSLPNVRKLFIPDPGMTFFDIDLSSADLRIVTWESGEDELKAMFRENLDPYTEIAKEFYRDPGITKKDPRRQLFKSFAHGCLTAGHEVLTPSGWVPIEDYDESTPLMTWNKDDWSAKFEVPKGMVRDLGTEFVRIEGQSYDCEMTKDHRVPFTTDLPTRIGVTTANAIPASARLPMCGYLNGNMKVSDLEARLLAAFQADGHLDPHGNVRFHFHRQRKKDRMRSMLQCYCPGEFTESPDSFYIPRRTAGFTHFSKIAGPYLLQWEGDALDSYLDELQHWDGSATGTIKCHLTTTNKIHAEWIQTIAKLRGFGSQMNLGRKADGNRQDLYRVSLNQRKFFNMLACPRYEKYSLPPTAVYCPVTSTGFFFVRRNGKIFVTGNSNYLGTAQGLAERLGLSVHESERTQKWYFQRFPRIKKWQEHIKWQVRSKRMLENVFGYKMFFFDRITENTFNEAAAWLPQSTVAILINKAYARIYKEFPEAEILLQVHDSLAGQYPSRLGDWAKSRIIECAENPLPYPNDPMIIPVGIKTSDKSWGDCK